MKKPRLAVLTAMILTAAAARLLPHPPNFTPIAAMALFGGASFADRRLAFAVPLAALLLSDLCLGFYRLLPIVYGSFALIVCIGFWLRTRRRVLPVVVTALAGSFLFFLITNFGVWATGALYPQTWSGLGNCYGAAIPFFRNTLLGDGVFTAMLFGGLALAEKHFPILRAPCTAAPVPCV